MKTFEQFNREFTGTGAVAGAGDDSSTVVVRRKYDRKNKRKNSLPMLKRMLASRQKHLEMSKPDIS